LPCGVAENGDGRGARDVVRGLKHAAGVGADAKGREIIARDIFGALGLGHSVADADVHHVLAGLEGGELLEFGGTVLEFTVKVVGEEIEVAVVVDEAAVDAAVVEVAYAV